MNQTPMPDPSRRRFLKRAAFSAGGVALGAAALNELSPEIWPEPHQFDSNGSYWARSQPPQNPPLQQDISVDVAIVGGGLTGLSAAYYLRKLSPVKQVAVLEARGCGNGASGRNGAMVLTMTADRYIALSSSPETDKEIYDLTAANIRRLAELSAATGIDCELETNGALQVLNTDDDIRAARTYVQKARSLGMPVEFWEKPKVVAAIGTEAYEAAFFDPSGGQVHPMKLVQVFKAAAGSAGARIYENTVVTNIEEGSEHVLHTEDGHRVKAASLVLASNASTSRLGYLRNSIVPVREYVAMTPPLDAQQLTGTGWRRRLPFNDSRTEVYYLGLTRDNRIHIGGGGPSYRFNGAADNKTDSISHFSQLRRELVRLYPSLKNVEFDVGWSGVVDWSLDESPAVGRMGKHGNIFYAIGYSGHGVNLTSVFGRILADLEAGRDQPWKPYPFVNVRLDYIPNEPFRWLGAQIGLAWYRLNGG